MDDIKTQLSCPLGHKCREIKDGVINQCTWFTKLAGQNPSTGEKIDEYGCAIAWMPILLIENSKQQLTTAVAIESFRNEMVAANHESQRVLQMTAGILSNPPQSKVIPE